MITKETVIYPLRPRMHARKTAMAYYRKWNGVVTFKKDENDYLKNGFVLSRPDLYWMAKIINMAPYEESVLTPEMREKSHRTIGKPVWFVRIAVGDLSALLSTLPCYLPKIVFCRKGDLRLRIYSLDKLLKKVREKREK